MGYSESEDDQEKSGKKSLPPESIERHTNFPTSPNNNLIDIQNQIEFNNSEDETVVNGSTDINHSETETIIVDSNINSSNRDLNVDSNQDLSTLKLVKANSEVSTCSNNLNIENSDAINITQPDVKVEEDTKGVLLQSHQNEVSSSQELLQNGSIQSSEDSNLSLIVTENLNTSSDPSSTLSTENTSANTVDEETSKKILEKLRLIECYIRQTKTAMKKLEEEGDLKKITEYNTLVNCLKELQKSESKLKAHLDGTEPKTTGSESIGIVRPLSEEGVNVPLEERLERRENEAEELSNRLRHSLARRQELVATYEATRERLSNLTRERMGIANVERKILQSMGAPDNPYANPIPGAEYWTEIQLENAIKDYCGLRDKLDNTLKVCSVKMRTLDENDGSESRVELEGKISAINLKKNQNEAALNQIVDLLIAKRHQRESAVSSSGNQATCLSDFRVSATEAISQNREFENSEAIFNNAEAILNSSGAGANSNEKEANSRKNSAEFVTNSEETVSNNGVETETNEGASHNLGENPNIDVISNYLNDLANSRRNEVTTSVRNNENDLQSKDNDSQNGIVDFQSNDSNVFESDSYKSKQEYLISLKEKLNGMKRLLDITASNKLQDFDANTAPNGLVSTLGGSSDITDGIYNPEEPEILRIDPCHSPSNNTTELNSEDTCILPDDFKLTGNIIGLRGEMYQLSETERKNPQLLAKFRDLRAAKERLSEMEGVMEMISKAKDVGKPLNEVLTHDAMDVLNRAMEEDIDDSTENDEVRDSILTQNEICEDQNDQAVDPRLAELLELREQLKEKKELVERLSSQVKITSESESQKRGGASTLVDRTDGGFDEKVSDDFELKNSPTANFFRKKTNLKHNRARANSQDPTIESGDQMRNALSSNCQGPENISEYQNQTKNALNFNHPNSKFESKSTNDYTSAEADFQAAKEALEKGGSDTFWEFASLCAQEQNKQNAGQRGQNIGQNGQNEVRTKENSDRNSGNLEFGRNFSQNKPNVRQFDPVNISQNGQSFDPVRIQNAVASAFSQLRGVEKTMNLLYSELNNAVGRFYGNTNVENTANASVYPENFSPENAKKNNSNEMATLLNQCYLKIEQQSRQIQMLTNQIQKLERSRTNRGITNAEPNYDLNLSLVETRENCSNFTKREFSENFPATVRNEEFDSVENNNGSNFGNSLEENLNLERIEAFRIGNNDNSINLRKGKNQKLRNVSVDDRNRGVGENINLSNFMQSKKYRMGNVLRNSFNYDLENENNFNLNDITENRTSVNRSVDFSERNRLQADSRNTNLLCENPRQDLKISNSYFEPYDHEDLNFSLMMKNFRSQFQDQKRNFDSRTHDANRFSLDAQLQDDDKNHIDTRALADSTLVERERTSIAGTRNRDETHLEVEKLTVQTPSRINRLVPENFNDEHMIQEPRSQNYVNIFANPDLRLQNANLSANQNLRSQNYTGITAENRSRNNYLGNQHISLPEQNSLNRNISEENENFGTNDETISLILEEIGAGGMMADLYGEELHFDSSYSRSFAPEDLNRCRNLSGGLTNILNNQVLPGDRANNYWDNFRSYSRQNPLSSDCKSNMKRSAVARPNNFPQTYNLVSDNRTRRSANSSINKASDKNSSKSRRMNEMRQRYTPQSNRNSAVDPFSSSKHERSFPIAENGQPFMFRNDRDPPIGGNLLIKNERASYIGNSMMQNERSSPIGGNSIFENATAHSVGRRHDSKNAVADISFSNEFVRNQTVDDVENIHEAGAHGRSDASLFEAYGALTMAEQRMLQEEKINSYYDTNQEKDENIPFNLISPSNGNNFNCQSKSNSANMGSNRPKLFLDTLFQYASNIRNNTDQKIAVDLIKELSNTPDDAHKNKRQQRENSDLQQGNIDLQQRNDNIQAEDFELYRDDFELEPSFIEHPSASVIMSKRPRGYFKKSSELRCPRNESALNSERSHESGQNNRDSGQYNGSWRDIESGLNRLWLEPDSEDTFYDVNSTFKQNIEKRQNDFFKLAQNAPINVNSNGCNRGSKLVENSHRRNLNQWAPNEQIILPNNPNERNLMQNYPNERNLMQSYPNERNLMQSYPNDRNSMQNYPNERNLMQNYPNERNLIQNYSKERNVIQNYSKERNVSQNCANELTGVQNYSNKRKIVKNDPNERSNNSTLECLSAPSSGNRPRSFNFVNKGNKFENSIGRTSQSANSSPILRNLNKNKTMKLSDFGQNLVNFDGEDERVNRNFVNEIENFKESPASDHFSRNDIASNKASIKSGLEKSYSEQENLEKNSIEQSGQNLKVDSVEESRNLEAGNFKNPVPNRRINCLQTADCASSLSNSSIVNIHDCDIYTKQCSNSQKTFNFKSNNTQGQETAARNLFEKHANQIFNSKDPDSKIAPVNLCRNMIGKSDENIWKPQGAISKKVKNIPCTSESSIFAGNQPESEQNCMVFAPSLAFGNLDSFSEFPSSSVNRENAHNNSSYSNNRRTKSIVATSYGLDLENSAAKSQHFNVAKIYKNPSTVGKVDSNSENSNQKVVSELEVKSSEFESSLDFRNLDSLSELPSSSVIRDNAHNNSSFSSNQRTKSIVATSYGLDLEDSATKSQLFNKYLNDHLEHPHSTPTKSCNFHKYQNVDLDNSESNTTKSCNFNVAKIYQNPSNVGKVDSNSEKSSQKVASEPEVKSSESVLEKSERNSLIANALGLENSDFFWLNGKSEILQFDREQKFETFPLNQKQKSECLLLDHAQSFEILPHDQEQNGNNFDGLDERSLLLELNNDAEIEEDEIDDVEEIDEDDVLNVLTSNLPEADQDN